MNDTQALKIRLPVLHLHGEECGDGSCGCGCGFPFETVSPSQKVADPEAYSDALRRS